MISNKEKYNRKDIMHFFILYIIAIITVYKLPNVFAYVYFGILLVLFWNSKKNAFWMILIFFMVDTPGELFPEDFNYGLPFIKGVNLRFLEIFFYVAFLKALKQKNKFSSVYLNQYILLLFLTLVLLVYTFFIDSSFRSLIISIKWLFAWSFLYSATVLMSDMEDWIFFFRLCFIIVFVAFFSQILYLLLGYPPAYLLGTDFNPMMDRGDIILKEFDTTNYSDIEARPISCTSIVQTALIGSMFFLQYKVKIFKKSFLYLVMIFSYVSIILCATRGWFIAFTLVIGAYFVIFQNFKKLFNIFLILILLLPVLIKIPVFQDQIDGAFKRISTIESVARGDISAGGTNARGEYGRVLVKYWEDSPLFGWGFSDFFKEHENGHAGHANLLFSVGIFGYLIFIIFWYHLYTRPIKSNKSISNLNNYKGSLLVFTLGFLTYFIIHSTSAQQFCLYIALGSGVLSQAFFYSFSSFFIMEAIKEDRIILTDTTVVSLQIAEQKIV